MDIKKWAAKELTKNLNDHTGAWECTTQGCGVVGTLAEITSHNLQKNHDGASEIGSVSWFILHPELEA